MDDFRELELVVTSGLHKRNTKATKHKSLAQLFSFFLLWLLFYFFLLLSYLKICWSATTAIRILFFFKFFLVLCLFLLYLIYTKVARSRERCPVFSSVAQYQSEKKEAKRGASIYSPSSNKLTLASSSSTLGARLVVAMTTAVATEENREPRKKEDKKKDKRM